MLKLRKSRDVWNVANQATTELEELIVAFFASRPYEIRVENISGNDVYRMRLAARIPRRFYRLSAKIVKNLHASLGSLMSELATQNGASRQKSKQFPFASSAAGFEELLRLNLDHLPDDALQTIRQSRPYPEGDRVLYALLPVSRIAPRKLLIARASANAVLVHQQQNVINGPATLTAPVWDQNRREVTMVGADPDSQLSGQAQVRFFIAFRGIDLVSDLPALAVLKHQLSVIDQLIAALKERSIQRRPPGSARRRSFDEVDDTTG